jgi:succinylglutamate desuccinylase
MKINKTHVIKKGDTPGKNLVVFCGVHGNETAGIFAVQRAIEEIEVNVGEVHFVFANPRAIEQGTRFTEKNLNRCFKKNNIGDTYEEERAQELMKTLDDADALLDLHASNIPGSQPFLICEEDAFPVVEKFDFPIVATGFDAIEPGGTDGYMFQQGKVGICAECGYAGEGERYADLAFSTIAQFLAHYGAIEYQSTTDKKEKKHLHVDRVIMKEREDFLFERTYSDFDELAAGECFARDGENEYRVERESVILFANPEKEVGGEACILGYWKK